MKYQSDFDRADRVGQQIHELVARLFLTGVEDPRLRGIQIVDVDMSPNLRNARIYYVMLDGEEPTEEAKNAAEGVAGFIKSEIGKQLRLRYIPDVELRFDEAVLKGRHIDNLLSNLRDD